jgi:hypothetical protein
VATAPLPKMSTITVRAQRRSVTTSGLTDATLRVPGLVGSTCPRPAGDTGGGVVGVVVPGVVVGAVVGVVVSGVVGAVVVGTGGRAARSGAVAATVVVTGGGGGGAERVVGGGDVGGLVGEVGGGGGGLVGGGGGGGWVCVGPPPMLMQMIGSRQMRKSGAMTCWLPTATAASAPGAAARNRMGTATATPPILARIRPLLPDGDSVRPVSCE